MDIASAVPHGVPSSTRDGWRPIEHGVLIGQPELDLMDHLAIEVSSALESADLLARAEASRSPVRILESLFRWASLSAAGFFVLVGSMMGYFLGTVFILVAALKPFHPQTAGLWLLRDSTGDPEISLRLGFGSVPGAGRDVLGWWIVPIGLLAGCAVVMLTTRVALWCARQYRRSHLLPRS